MKANRGGGSIRNQEIDMSTDSGCTLSRRTRRSSRLLAALAAALWAVPSARAQELLWEVDGDGSDSFGGTLATLADIDGDGIAEVVVGALDGGGGVRVLSGASGAILWEWVSTTATYGFGNAIADAGDVDGDGVADVIVGAMGVFTSQTGDAYVYSGASGSLLQSFSGIHVGDEFGAAVIGLGDVDGDALSDLAIGAPTQMNGSGYDRIEVHSGGSGLSLYTVLPTTPGDDLGAALALLDDLDGDGVRDFAASAIVGQYVDIVSGKSGAILRTIHGPASYLDLFGKSLAAIGDLDGDGFGDLLVGSPLRHAGGNIEAGAAEVYSTGSGALLQRQRGTAFTRQQGITVASAGDSNGDGAPDLLVGSFSGYAELYSGASGRLLYRFKDAPTLYDGAGVAGGADIDGDGLADVVVGEPDGGSPSHRGHVEVHRGSGLYLDSEPYGPTAGATFSLTLGEGVPGNLALIALTAVNGAPGFVPLAIAPLDVNGELALQGSVPPGLAGTSADFLGLAISASGKLVASAIETVAFQ
jgi:hypothetical protein